MTAKELRQKYLDFFASKGHAIIPSASLIPENDPTTLFTGSGMQPMIQYLLGEKHPMGTRIADSQKCFRAKDIEEVGDNRHTTMFEMLGNWSLGDYFKEEQITWIFDFLTKEVGLNPEKIYVTVFRGNDELNIPQDDESVAVWQKLFKTVGINAKAVNFSEEKGMQDGRIFYYPVEKNWWSRSGVPENMPVGEPGGPDSEMFWDFGVELGIHEKSAFKNQPCHVNCDCGRFLEIGNNVFMQYIKTETGFELLKQKNVDFGGGLERILAATNDNPDIFLTNIFSSIILKIEQISGKKYENSEETKKSFRVIADHLKASTFLMADGVTPSNTRQGYFLRRLIRRSIRYGHQLGIGAELWTKEIAKIVAHDYAGVYPELQKNIDKIIEQLNNEETKFKKTLELGLKKFNEFSELRINQTLIEKTISGRVAFDLYQTYGFPLEMILEEANNRGLRVDTDGPFGFYQKAKEHQELSRTASAGMFKGGLADSSEATIKYHTAAHLLLAALRKVLGAHVTQKGSNITADRLRFDFSHAEKMTEEQKKSAEDLVNQSIRQDLPVICQELPLEQAKASGALGVFEAKYGERVKVYTIGGSSAGSEPPFSREICGGPHVEKTGALGHFRIIKEESSSAGIRRIKAILE